MITFVFFIQLYFMVYTWKVIYSSTPDLYIEKSIPPDNSLFHVYTLKVLNKHVEALYNFLNDFPFYLETIKLSRSNNHTTCSIETCSDATNDLYELALDHTDMKNVRFYINKMLIE